MDTLQTPGSGNEHPPGGPELLDMWGDTVLPADLIKALVLTLVVTIPLFLIGQEVGSAKIEDPTLSRAVALLFGLVGCLGSGLACALLFKPKRVIVAATADSSSRREALAILAADPNGLGSVDELDDEVKDELRALGLYDVFLDAEQNHANAPAARTAANPSLVQSGGNH